jgi:manganese-dependent inorganic pyrophosphatase
MMKYFAQSQVLPDKKLASLMLGAILSDTVGYKSSTTTSRDKSFGDELAKIAEISDVEAFTLEIFKAKSDISSLTDEQIVTNDYKIFKFGKKTLIDQLETVEQAEILTSKKASLLKAMAKIKTEQQVELLFVAITDILQVNTKLLILGEAEQEVAEQAFGGRVEDNVLDIGPKCLVKKILLQPSKSTRVKKI